MASLLLERQHRLLLVARRFDVRQTKAATENPEEVLLVHSDLRNLQLTTIESILTKCINGVSHVVFVCNAAVVTPIGLARDLPVDELPATVTVNFTACMQLTIAILKAAGSVKVSVRILNISSGAALRPVAGWSVYCSTKAGLHMFLDVLSSEAAVSNEAITVAHIDPGVMDTKMQEAIRVSSKESFPRHEEFVEMHRTGKLRSPEVAAREILSREGLL
jgi:benzil reductase ((S)-benzoin forming)